MRLGFRAAKSYTMADKDETPSSAPPRRRARRSSGKRRSGIAGLEGLEGFKSQQMQSLLTNYGRFQRLQPEHGGLLDRKQLVSMLNESGFVLESESGHTFKSAGEMLADRLFRTFDTNDDGGVDFSEVCAGLSVLMEGNPEDRAEMCFHAFDLNGDGVISKSELTTMAKAVLVQALGSNAPQTSDASIELFVKCVFERFYHNIALKEWQLAWKDDAQFGHVFSLGNLASGGLTPGELRRMSASEITLPPLEEGAVE